MFLTFLDELNQAVASSGHPETQYRTWKVTGEQTGDYAYLFGSVWADRATYDTVHEHPNYKAVWERHEETYQSLIPEEVYNQYERLMLQ